MDNSRIEYKNNQVIFSGGRGDVGSRSPSKNDFTRFREWIGSYTRALKQLDNKEILLTIGREIYNWLNGDQNFLETILQNAENPFIIEFQIPKRSSEIQKAFIEVPWELLADKTGHLAKDATLKFSPVRRIGRENKPKPEPSEYRLNTVFMAASPRNVKLELAYEQEESAILNLHTRNSFDMDLFVEESGELDQLTRFVNDRKPVDVVHISCHGNIFKDLDNKNNKAYLCLEDFAGNLNRMEPDSFCRIFSQNRPVLTFLSACKTAEARLNHGSSEDETFSTFTHVLIEQGFPAVLGWSGSVSDSEATRFASCLYRELTQSSTLENAVALARSLLFVPPREETKEHESRDWHLARLYLGADGGGTLSKGKKIRFDYHKDAGVKEFLGKKEKGLEVASRKEFVGRRRRIQDILKEFKENNHAGILIHGLGNQGKSSLAARIANRMYDHETVLIYGKKGEERLYSARHVLNEFKTVSSDIETEKRIDELLQEVTRDESLLKPSLKELLEDPFSGRDEKHRAVLMVVDDLEKILTLPDADSKIHGVGIDYRTTLISIINAFKKANTKSRLLLTSRYDFDLIDDFGRDICGDLLKLTLTAMNDTEAEKQYFAKYGELADENKEIKLELER
ncbi:MAG: CHAT domain-containing protein, partial [Desulfobulbaceae bacterium]|nr:CHAT domain-containing protein [Desulfobulbaceae bacterium]